MIHTGGASARLDVQVAGRKGADEVVSQSAQLSFLKGEVRELRVTLNRDCVGVSCDEGTCRAGTCVSSEVDSVALPEPGEASPEVHELDAGKARADAAATADSSVPREAGGWDAARKPQDVGAYLEGDAGDDRDASTADGGAKGCVPSAACLPACILLLPSLLDPCLCTSTCKALGVDN